MGAFLTISHWVSFPSNVNVPRVSKGGIASKSGLVQQPDMHNFGLFSVPPDGYESGGRADKAD